MACCAVTLIWTDRHTPRARPAAFTGRGALGVMIDPSTLDYALIMAAPMLVLLVFLLAGRR